MNTRHPWQQTEIIPSQTSILKHIFEILANEFNQWYAGKLICSIYQFPSCKYFNLAHFKGTISSQKPVPVNSSIAAETVETSSVLQLDSLWPHRLQHHQASLSITSSWSLLKLMCIELVMLSNHLILCGPLLLLPSIFPSIRGFFNESVLRIKCQSNWSFSFSISPSNEYSGLIFFRID